MTTLTRKNNKIYVVGNLLVEEDSLPIRLIPFLKKSFPNISFIEFDPSEDVGNEEEITLIDTVFGIKEIKIIQDLEKFKKEKIYSLHDFDLGYTLKLMKKFGLLKKITIIGVPPSLNEKKAKEQLSKAIKRLS